MTYYEPDHDPWGDDEPEQPEPGWRDVAAEERRIQAGRAGIEQARAALADAIERRRK